MIEIPFDELIEPCGTYESYRVREVNTARVNQLAERLKVSKKEGLSSTLTVLKMDGTRHLIIDGSHRYRAMKKIREEDEKQGAPLSYKRIHCRVFEGLSMRQALETGFMKNLQAGDVYGMSDFDYVEVIRKTMADTNESKALQDVYAMTGATKVILKQLFESNKAQVIFNFNSE